jgi:phage major head subunit gpT-like protein
MITSGQLNLLRVGLTEILMREFEKPNIFGQIYEIDNSNKEYEEYQHIVGLPALPEWDADGAELPFMSATNGYKVLFVHKDYGYAWAISKRLMRGDQYQVVAGRLTRTAVRAAQNTIELLTTAFYATNPTWVDGKQLFATDHPYEGGTYNNKITAPLTDTSLQEALRWFRRAVDWRGNPIMIEPAVLMVPPELEVTAKVLVGSMAYPTTSSSSPVQANAGTFNPFKGTLDVVVNPYLVDTNDWFVFASPSVGSLKFFWREKPTIVTERDFRTQGILNAITMAFSYGAVDVIGMVGSIVAGG